MINTGKYLTGYLVFTGYLPGIYLGIYLGIYRCKYPECIYLKVFRSPYTRKSAKSHEILRKFEQKWVITLLVKR